MIIALINYISIYFFNIIKLMKRMHLPLLSLTRNRQGPLHSKPNSSIQTSFVTLSHYNNSFVKQTPSSNLFATQIPQSTISSFHNTITSFNKTRLIKKINKRKMLKTKIKESCNDIDKKCIVLNNNMNNNPLLVDNNYINYTSKPIKDVTMISLKEEISTLGKEIDKKGVFVTISDPSNKVSKGEDPNKLMKIFVSENPNNIFNRTTLAEKMNPLSVLKFKKKMNKDYNLNLRLGTNKVVENEPYLKFLRAYNREFAYAKRFSEQYNIKTNNKATYLVTL